MSDWNKTYIKCIICENKLDYSKFKNFISCSNCFHSQKFNITLAILHRYNNLTNKSIESNSSRMEIYNIYNWDSKLNKEDFNDIGLKDDNIKFTSYKYHDFIKQMMPNIVKLNKYDNESEYNLDIGYIDIIYLEDTINCIKNSKELMDKFFNLIKTNGIIFIKINIPVYKDSYFGYKSAQLDKYKDVISNFTTNSMNQLCNKSNLILNYIIKSENDYIIYEITKVRTNDSNLFETLYDEILEGQYQ
jgi:hypothetical protein